MTSFPTRRTIQYVLEVSHDPEQISSLEADLVLRERLTAALGGVFAVHLGRVQ